VFDGVRVDSKVVVLVHNGTTFSRNSRVFVSPDRNLEYLLSVR
jgi:hypothetical protein